MVRCEEFYKKWESAGNFCEKHEDTAERIEAYLDLLPKIKIEAAKNEIINDNSKTMGAIITERASRPLISLKDSAKRQEAIQQVVQLAEQKTMDHKKARVTAKEVEDIISKLVPQTQKTATAPKIIKLDTAKRHLEAALGNVADKPEAIGIALTTIEELCRFLETTKQSLTQRKEAFTHESALTIPEGSPINQIQPNPASAEPGT